MKYMVGLGYTCYMWHEVEAENYKGALDKAMKAPRAGYDDYLRFTDMDEVLADDGKGSFVEEADRG